jgi:hypothetical protein
MPASTARSSKKSSKLYSPQPPSPAEPLCMKIDPSDGFWLMIVEDGDGKEFIFVFQLPKLPILPPTGLGWQHIPTYFCTGTKSALTLFKRLIALTFTTGISVVHRHESYCRQAEPSILRLWSGTTSLLFTHPIDSPFQ